MERVTTLIATVGSRFDEPTSDVAEASTNVAIQPVPEPVEHLPTWVERLRPAWGAARRRSTIYTVMTGDPLGPVVREWARRLDGGSSDLELAIGLLAQAPVPDFYLVDPGISGTVAHWYLDHLARLAPRRIVLIEPDASTVRSALGRLPYGQSLPTTEALLESSRTYVPLPELDPGSPTTLLT